MAGSETVYKQAMSAGHSAAWDRQWEKAAEAYQKALDEFPGQPNALTSLGMALFEMQRFDESLQAYQKAARAAPNDPVPLEKVGQLRERMGMIPEAIQSFLKAAELYIRNQGSEKALENWLRVTQLDSDHITARSYLAMVHERLGHMEQATAEYLAVASLLQRSGQVDKSAEMIGRALRLSPRSQEAQQARALLKGGQLLPRPLHRQGGTAPLRMAQVKKLEAPVPTDSGLDPIAEARKNALTRLAEVLFDLTDEGATPQSSKRGVQEIVHGTGDLDMKQNDINMIQLHLSQAIDAQTRQQEAQAAEELDKALGAGFTDPALYFDLGYLRSRTDRVESAMRSLQVAVKHEAYTLGARLLMAEIQHQLGRLQDSVTEYMEALKTADSMVVPADQADALRQLYEPLIEANANQSDPDSQDRMCENIRKMLLKPNWRAGLVEAREQLPKPEEGSPLLPLAEILSQTQSGQVIEKIGKVRSLARSGYLRSAMDEAFESIKVAPTYLPLHTLIGDLLIQEGRTQDAIAKYAVVAQAYSVRGEASQAVKLLRRIVQVSPMDLVIRNRLIEQLASRGMVDEAIGEYIDLADIYYRLAELDLARKTYTTALQLAQQGGANRAWSIKLMRRMADIDMQRLDLRQAMRIFEQLRTLEPGDASVRKSLIDLNIRLNMSAQAEAELGSYQELLKTSGKKAEAVPFLEDLINDYPRQAFLRRALAEEFRQARRIPDAVTQLDALGDILLEGGDRGGARQAMEAIVALNPPNLKVYQTLLAKLRSEG